MSRNIVTEGIILKTSVFGEIHKSVALMTPDHGILHVIAHGALKMKSKLRSSTQPFYRVRAYVYHDPVKASYKFTDVETIGQCYGISESIEKFYMASLVAEVILKSYGGGESGSDTFGLVSEAIACLDCALPREIPYVIIQFIHRYLVMTGYGPELRSCGRCGKIFEDDVRAYFGLKSREFVCADCSDGENVRILPGMLKYLEKTGTLGFDKSMEISMDKASADSLKGIMYSLIERLLEVELSSIKSAEGII